MNNQKEPKLEAMKTIICASNPTPYLSRFSPRKPNSPAFNPTTLQKLNYPLSTLKPPYAYNAKGFSGTRPSTIESDVTSKKPTKGKKDEDDEIPREVFNRIIVRIVVSVGAPMGLGLTLLYIFGELKERQIWDLPMWIPFLTTFLTFGASTLGIAYGALSTSLDAEREGSFLGFSEVQKNWAEMWKEEDQS